MSASPIGRYQSRVEELESLRGELENKSREGELAPMVSLVLEAAGDLLRRSKAVKFDAAVVDAALKAIPESALTSWAAAVSVEKVRSRIARAADEAVEAAIPEVSDDSDVIIGFAMQDLMHRDRFESSLEALKRLANRGRSDAQKLHTQLTKEIKAADVKARKTVAGLTVLNAARRAEAAILDDECRSTAWWLTERSGLEDDALVKILAGETRGALSDVEREVSEFVKEPRTRPIGFDELFRYDLGLASPAEKAAIEAQAGRDPDMKLVLAALKAGDEAIEEEVGGEVVTVTPGNRVERLVTSGKPEIISENEDFKVLIFRAKRVSVVVQPLHPDRFAAAAVFVSNRPNHELPGTSTSHGLEFDLGLAESLSGRSARVVVRLKAGGSITSEIAL